MQDVGRFEPAGVAALPSSQDVRLRGLEVTRLETFCDAAFASAVTLLVISGSTIPRSYAALVEALKDVPAFLTSFAAIALMWVAHRQWSRRYGLEDGWTTLISLSVVFVMLVYVYPPQMVASAFMSFASGGWLPSAFTIVHARDLPGLFVVYGVGLAVQMTLLVFLYVRALRLGESLRLNDVERLRTRQEIALHATVAATAVASALFAGLLPTIVGIWAGFVYMTLPVTMPITAVRYARRVEALKADAPVREEDT